MVTNTQKKYLNADKPANIHLRSYRQRPFFCFKLIFLYYSEMITQTLIPGRNQQILIQFGLIIAKIA